jgi:hypothetical protein
VPTAQQLAVGELAINLADRRLYSKDTAGSVFRLARPRDPSDYLSLSATDGTTLYIGRLAWDDYPATGPAEDSTAWTIYRITSNAAGDVTATASAVGAFSNKQNLTYA